MECEFMSLVELVILFLTMALFTSPYWPNKYNPVRFYARYAVYYLCYYMFSFIILPICILRPKNPSNNKIYAFLSKFPSWILNLNWEIENKEIIEKDEGLVVVANHQSSFDILGMFAISYSLGKFATIAKKELMYVFPFGLITYLCGHVFIDRKNKESAVKQLKITEKLMNEHKIKVFVFPEGTRNKTKEPMLEFKKGAFVMAINAQVPVVPIVYSPYYFINREKKFFDSKGTVIITVLDPISTKGMTLSDVPKLMKMTRDKMIRQYENSKKDVSECLADDYPFDK